MKNSTIVIFAVWIGLAVLDFLAVFINVPLAFQFVFSALNAVIIVGSIPLFVEEFKARKALKLMNVGTEALTDADEKTKEE